MGSGCLSEVTKSAKRSKLRECAAYFLGLQGFYGGFGVCGGVLNLKV